MTQQANVYRQNGFSDRAAYFKHLSEQYNVSVATVEAFADALGPNEDFDGLVIMLEDIPADYAEVI